MRVGRQQGTVAVVVVVCGLAAAGCGSTRTVTVTNTVVKASTTTVTASASATTPAPTTVGDTTPATPGKAPALSGTYGLQKTGFVYDPSLPVNNPHDGYDNADQKWTFMNGSCTARGCQVDLRRTLSDSTIEDLTLFSDSPAGVYTGTIPGGYHDDGCSGNAPRRIKETMNVRVGGLQSVGGQTVASRLLGHIFFDYTCPGNGPTHDVATYVGKHA